MQIQPRSHRVHFLQPRNHLKLCALAVFLDTQLNFKGILHSVNQRRESATSVANKPDGQFSAGESGSTQMGFVQNSQMIEWSHVVSCAASNSIYEANLPTFELDVYMTTLKERQLASTTG